MNVRVVGLQVKNRNVKNDADRNANVEDARELMIKQSNSKLNLKMSFIFVFNFFSLFVQFTIAEFNVTKLILVNPKPTYK